MSLGVPLYPSSLLCCCFIMLLPDVPEDVNPSHSPDTERTVSHRQAR